RHVQLNSLLEASGAVYSSLITYQPGSFAVVRDYDLHSVSTEMKWLLNGPKNRRSVPADQCMSGDPSRHGGSCNATPRCGRPDHCREPVPRSCASPRGPPPYSEWRLLSAARVLMDDRAGSVPLSGPATAVPFRTASARTSRR